MLSQNKSILSQEKVKKAYKMGDIEQFCILWWEILLFLIPMLNFKRLSFEVWPQFKKLFEKNLLTQFSQNSKSDLE